MRTREEGVYLVAVAAIAAVVLLLLTSLGINTSITKQAHQELAEKAEGICRGAAQFVPIQQKVSEYVRDQVNALNAGNLLKHISIEDVRVIVPTSPTQDITGIYHDPNSYNEACNFQNYVPPMTAFEGLLDTGCSDGTACKFNGVLCNGDGGALAGGWDGSGEWTPEAGYPSDFWNQIQNVGNTVACEFKAHVKLPWDLSGGEGSEINFKTVWWRPLRGPKPVYNPEAAFETSPNLVVAVAPHMTTQAEDPRFRFGSLYSDEFRQEFDPLYAFGTLAEKNGFSVAQPTRDFYYQGGGTTSLMGMPLLSRTHRRADPPPVQGSPPGTLTAELRAVLNEPDPYQNLGPCGPTAADIPGVNCLRLSDAEQMLVACSNPALLVKNVFLSTLLELAARHGHMRNTTEFLMVNTSHMGTLSQEVSNFPAQIVGLGEDLSSRAYQTPFTFFYGGTQLDPPPNPQGWPKVLHKNGWIDPETGPVANLLPLQKARHRALIASQLRYCNHLFHNSGQGMLNRFLKQFGEDALLDNGALEDGARYGVYTNLRDTPYPSPDLYANTWDQNCPWLGSGISCPYDTPQGGGNMQMTAAEIGASLGAVQACPFEHAQVPIGGNGGYLTTCQKPGNPIDDLKPDLAGLFYYLQGTALASKSPGLFHVSNDNLPTIQSSDDGALIGVPSIQFKPDKYIQRAAPPTMTVVVLHRIGDINDMNLLVRDALSSEPFKDRPVLAVYLPTRAADATPAAIEKLECAFYAKLSYNGAASTCDSGAYSEQHKVLVFSPYLAHYNGQFETGNEAQDFATYWHYLLDPNSENNIVNSTWNIWNHLILDEELKF